MKTLIGEREENVLKRTLNWITEGVGTCMESGAYIPAMLLMCCSIDILSSYYVGSRREAFSHSGKRFIKFIKRYFFHFKRESTDEKGHFLKKRVNVSYKGGKAKKRMDYPSILNYWYRKGMIQEIVFKEGLSNNSPGKGHYFLEDPAFSILVNVDKFHLDFKEALKSFYEDIHRDPRLQENFWKRFLSLYGRNSWVKLE